MDPGELVRLIETLRERAKAFGSDLQLSEALTRYALVDPTLRALGWATDDPARVRVEYPAGTGKVDYCLLDADGKPLVLIEAKPLNSPKPSVATSAVVTYAFQLLRTIGPNRLLVGITDGLRWYLYEIPHLQEPRAAFNLGEGSPAEAALKLLGALWLPLIRRQDAPQPAPDRTAQSPPPPGEPPPISLSRLVGTVKHGDPPPRRLLLPNAQGRRLESWKDLIAAVGEYLAETEKLGPKLCPIRPERASRRFLVHTERRHPSGREFFQPVQLKDGLWLETNWSSPEIVRYSVFLLKFCGEDPDRWQVVFRS